MERASISEPSNINHFNDFPNCGTSNSFDINSQMDHETSFEYSFQSEANSFEALSFGDVTSKNQDTNEIQQQIFSFFDGNDKGANVTIPNGPTYQNFTTSTDEAQRFDGKHENTESSCLPQFSQVDLKDANPSNQAHHYFNPIWSYPENVHMSKVISGYETLIPSNLNTSNVRTLNKYASEGIKQHFQGIKN